MQHDTSRLNTLSTRGVERARGVLYLADGHHVIDAGNLISCAYVDLRAPAERIPIGVLGVLGKTSSKRHPIRTVGRFRSRSRTAASRAEEVTPSRGRHRGRRAPAGRAGGACVNCGCSEPKTPEEQGAWRAAMPADYDVISHPPSAKLARALGAMAAEQLGPRGQTAGQCGPQIRRRPRGSRRFPFTMREPTRELSLNL